MYEKAGLDSLSIASKIEETLNSNIVLAKKKIKYLINYTVLYALINDQELHSISLLHQLELLLFLHKDHVFL